MAYGCSLGTSVAIELVANHRWMACDHTKKSVVDLGIGSGIVGHAMRGVNGEIITRLHGVEGYPAHRWAQGRYDMWTAYDTVDEADIRQWVPAAIAGGEHFDVGLLMETLEHIPREAERDRIGGEELLDLLPQLADNWIVTTPSQQIQVQYQDVQFQGHLCVWTAEEFLDRGWTILLPGVGDSWSDFGMPMIVAYWGPWNLGTMRLTRSLRKQ